MAGRDGEYLDLVSGDSDVSENMDGRPEQNPAYEKGPTNDLGETVRHDSGPVDILPLLITTVAPCWSLGVSLLKVTRSCGFSLTARWY